jgi:steroid 5-alpha reductase family enzyme
MNPLLLALIGWAAMGAVMVVLSLVQRATKDAGVVDVGWAGGVGALAVFYAVMADGDTSRRLLLGILAGLWSFRLAGFLLKDRILAGDEDGRYRMLREKWGHRTQRNLFIFFQVQAFWAVLFSVPFLPVAYHDQPLLGWFDMVGIVVWVVALAGETAADRQLARFRADPANRGRTCQRGLWRYSRHPNYFFEWVHWFTYVFLAFGSPYVWLTLAGPAVMLLFLYKVTGIPYTEKQALISRGDDYRRYQETTSAFIPWVPKKPNE